MATKTGEILKFMQVGNTITNAVAVERFAEYRLSDVIYRLRKQGFEISTVEVEKTDKYGNKSRYAEYRLLKDKN